MAAKDLLLRVKFAGIDGLSRLLNNIGGSSKRAAGALAETSRELRKQKNELRDVQRQMQSGTGNLTSLIDKERALETSVARATKQLERQKKVVAINARTARLSAAGKDMVAGGQAGLFSAAMIAAPILAVAKAGAEFQSLQNRMRVLGLGNRAVDDLTDYARAMNIAGSAASDNMRYLLEAQGVFRESGEHNLADQLSGAKLMAPLLAKMHVIAQATGKELSEDQERYFLRFIEQAGGLSSSKRAAELTDGLFRALQSSGGNVQASDYQGFLAHAGIAGSHMSNRSMFADFEPLIGELHEQAGTGLATAMKMATGIKANSKAAAEFMRLGLWDPNKVVLNNLGGVKSTKGNPLKDQAAGQLAHDPVEFYRQTILPAYQRAGVNTSEGRTFENARLFGGTGGNLFNLIDKQLPTILRSRVAYQKTQSLNKAYNQTNDSFFGQEGKLRAAGKDFMVAAGTKGGLLDNVTSLMITATAALRSFTAFGNAHPTAFSWIGKIVTDLLLLKVGLSITKIAFGGLLGPVARIWGAWSKLKAAGSFAEAFPKIARIAGIARTALMFLAQGAMRAGMMMLANPMILIIVAIGAAIGVAAYLIYKHWDTIKKAFGTALTYISGLWQRFRAAGGQLLDGLVDGISSKIKMVKDMITGLGGKVIGWFKDKLGIHSPSRVFAGLGGHIASGLSLGIERGADGPVKRSRALAARVAAAMAIGSASPSIAIAGGIAAGAVGGAAAPVTIVHHHHYKITVEGGTGVDVKAQARELLVEIERLQAVKSRSSYRDHG